MKPCDYKKTIPLYIPGPEPLLKGGAYYTKLPFFPKFLFELQGPRSSFERLPGERLKVRITQEFPARSG
jgi:hypothetical protein